MWKSLKRFFPKSEAALLLSLLFFFSACSMNQLLQPEFTITSPVYKSHEEDSSCVSGGVYFNFYNKSGSAVVFMEIKMNVFDKRTGKMAFIGTGTIKSEYNIRIASGETKKLCVSLDPYITVRTEEGYYIDQFYISRVIYSDGHEWNDILGVHAVSGGGQ